MNDLLKYAADKYVGGQARDLGPGPWMSDDVEAAFIAGANWQMEQIALRGPGPVRLVPRLGPGVVMPRMVGVDFSGPDPDYSAASVVMSKVQWDTVQADLRTRSEAVEHWRQQVGKLESQVSRLKERNDGLACDVDKARAERDDWHHAYDKLVSDIVHGRATDKLASVIQDAAMAGIGVMFVDRTGNPEHVTLKEFFKPIEDESGCGCGAGVTEATGGFTAQGETESDQVRELKAHLEAQKAQASFWRKMAAARGSQMKELGSMLDDLLASHP